MTTTPLHNDLPSPCLASSLVDKPPIKRTPREMDHLHWNFAELLAEGRILVRRRTARPAEEQQTFWQILIDATVPALRRVP